MTNQAKIVITAVDQATATMLKIRAEMRAMTQPMRDIKASMGRFAEGSGLRQMQRDFQKIGHAARAVGGAVTRIVAPMAAIVGVGSIAGLAELSRQWANMGWTIERTAQTLGIAPEKLQALQGAAKLAGLSADDMTNSLGALGNTLQDALFGRNQQAMYALNQLGITIHKTATGAVDSTRALSDLSAVIQRYNGQPQVQQRIADQFGIGALLPLLRQGPEAIRRFEAQARSLGYVMGGDALRNSTALGQSFAELQMSLIGLRNSISNALFPVLTPMLNNLTQWVASNRQLIAQNVSRWVSEIVQWVRSVDWGAVWRDITGVIAEIRNMASGINDVVQSLGGWKTALELAFGAWALGKVGMFTLAVLRLARAFGAARTAAAALPAAVPAAEAATGAAARGLFGLGIGGLLGRAGLVGLAGFGGYEFGKHVVNPAIDWSVDKLTGGKDKNLGSAVYDWTHSGEDKNSVAKTLFPAMEHQYGLPKGMLDAVWWKESSRGKHLYSPKGALGDFQFMPKTAAEYGLKDPMSFQQSTVAAAKMYGGLLKQYKGDISKALAAYNWGSGNLNKDIARNGDNWLAYAPKETQDYVNLIQARMAGVDRPGLYAQGRISAAPQAQVAAAQQKVDITLHVKNAPPGTRVEARRADGDDVPVNVAYNMVGQH